MITIKHSKFSTTDALFTHSILKGHYLLNKQKFTPLKTISGRPLLWSLDRNSRQNNNKNIYHKNRRVPRPPQTEVNYPFHSNVAAMTVGIDFPERYPS